MQYILSEEEYKELIEAKENRTKAEAKKFQEFCTRVADELPVDWEWSDGEPKKPWGCILTKKHEWYCDQCPAQDFCPFLDKSWSK